MNIRRSLTIAVTMGVLLVVVCLWVLQVASRVAVAQPDVATIHVAGGGADTIYCGSMASPCATIQYALDSAAEGDIIQVAQGVYSGPLVITRSVSLLGGYEEIGWTRNILTYTTVISGNQAGPVIHVTNGSTATIEGFDIVGGQSDSGGGFLIEDAYPTVASNHIHDNEAMSYGGGIYFSAAEAVSKPIVISNTVYGNTAGVGGGVYLFATCELVGNEIRNNTASSGGGLSIGGPATATPLIHGNAIHGNNTTSAGGGVYIFGGTPRLEHNIITGNYIGGYQHGAGLYIYSSAAVNVVSNTIAYNSAPLGWGGGIYIAGGVVSVLDNDIHHNQAGNPAYRLPDGGGIHLEGAFGGAIVGNTIHDNWAVDQGGGIFSKSSVQMSNNRIENNYAGIGGGLSLWGAGAAGQIAGNTIAQNNGGGIYLWYYARPTINANMITSNAGGGLIIVDGATPTVNANLILSNTASYGGGVQIGGNARPILTNNVLRGNQASAFGDGVFVSGAYPQLLHNTLALNGVTGLYVTDNSQVTLINTILVSETVGITVTAGSTATVAGVLWFGNELDSGGEGAITVTHTHNGDPALASDGYHLTFDSAALDRGVSSDIVTDIDGNPRPAGPASDLGADEFSRAPGAVTISAPLTVLLNTPYSLTATVSPSVTTTPITFVWQATHHSPVTRTGGLSDTVVLVWPVTGPEMITVTARNAAGEATATHILTVNDVPVTGLTAHSSGPTRLDNATFFTATISSGTNASYAWDFGDGLTTTGALAAHTYATAGNYTVRVTAANSFNSQSASTPVTITNERPIAVALGDTYSSGMLVSLDGSGSFDPDDHMPLTYFWAQTGGTSVSFTPSLSVTTFTTPASPTVLTFTLTVSDSHNLPSLPKQVVITIADLPITGLAAQNSGPAVLGSATHFTASVVSGSNVSYTWNFGDGVTAIGRMAVHAYTAAGSYTASVTASNSVGSDSASMAVTVFNNAPIANAGNDQSVLIRSVVALDGSGSIDPDGHMPLAHNWTQTGGPTVILSAPASVSPTFTAPAFPTVLTFTLAVMDSFGLADPTPDEVVIRVAQKVYLPLILSNNGVDR